MTETEKSHCLAELTLSDYYGRNECVFKCELPQGHESFHTSRGSQNDTDYMIEWNQ